MRTRGILTVTKVSSNLGRSGFLSVIKDLAFLHDCYQTVGGGD
jgi:hypothetical protein